MLSFIILLIQLLIQSIYVLWEEKSLQQFEKYSLINNNLQTLKLCWVYTVGHSTSLISLKRLPHGNYSIPLKIQDQQGLAAEEVFNVVVCDCEGENVCRGRQGWSSRLDSAGIGLIFTGILLFACESKSQTKTFDRHYK